MGFAFLVFLTDAKVANIFQLMSRPKYDFGTHVFHHIQSAYSILVIVNLVHVNFKL